MRFCLVIFFGSLWGTLSAQTGLSVLSLHSPHQVTSLTPYIYFLKDDSQQLTLQEVVTNKFQSRFAPKTSKSPNYGRNGVVWLRFTLKGAKGKYLLELPQNALLGMVFFHPLPNGNYKKNKRSSFKEQKIKVPRALFEINLPDNAPHTFYIRCQSRQTLTIPLLVGSTYAFLSKNHKKNNFEGAFFGVMFIMFFYNLFIYLKVRDKSHLYYILYVTSFTIHISIRTGYAEEFLWPNHPEFNHYSFITNTLTMSFALLFARHFLKIKKYAPLMDKVISGGVYFLLLTLTIGFFNPSAALNLVLATTVVVTILLPVLGLVILPKYPLAKYYLLGWGGLLGSVLIGVLNSLEVIFLSIAPLQLIQIGVINEALMFSFALIERINHDRREKEEAQEAATQTMKIHNIVLEEEVKQRTKEIDFKNQQITQSITAAENIQQAMLPQEEDLAACFEHFFLLYKPKAIVSGDFYWVNKVNEEIILVVADCTGHGVQGAFMTLIGKTLLDKIILLEKITNPAKILERLHQDIVKSLKQEDTGNDQGMDAIVIATDTATPLQQFVFASAKVPLYYAKPRTGEVTILKGTSRYIGGKQRKQTPFVNQHIHLEKGDMMYMGSDGYKDQNNDHRQSLGTSNFLTLLSSVVHLPLKTQKQYLDDYLHTYMKDTTQRDDILIMGFKV
ncbi:7TM diverse intracellular signaling domain-containing protein [Microscilla marina]|uniref:Serine/threonine protein kinases n=1 Tax=Microscilla marina ATCC 23134 TaxID=313606 RepID=A1ZNQ0_MICM2|nr:7TM diverse intracellular signaling domain-containing protein [Microscilla marina]EAY27939.1 serine/threonine protein kinases [Microscilla marina ATCC 23134]